MSINNPWSPYEIHRKKTQSQILYAWDETSRLLDTKQTAILSLNKQ